MQFAILEKHHHKDGFVDFKLRYGARRYQVRYDKWYDRWILATKSGREISEDGQLGMKLIDFCERNRGA